MKTIIMASLTLLVAVTLARAGQNAGATPEHVFTDEALLKDKNRGVYVIQVKAVDEMNATNAKPPRVTLLIKETLRGDIKKGAEIVSIWSPMPHDIDTGGREKDLAVWSSQPLKGPKIGEELIILEYYREPKQSFTVNPRCRYPFTAAKRDWVISTILGTTGVKEESKRAP